jgi:acetyl/propionyl-CoA carboxylase alpha subunit
MSGDFYLDPQELAKLAGAFDTRAYDLARAVRAFQGTTGAEQIHDGFGFLTESEEVTSAYVELATGMVESLGNLARHFDEVSQALKDNAKNSEASDEALTGLFKGGKT